MRKSLSKDIPSDAICSHCGEKAIYEVHGMYVCKSLFLSKQDQARKSRAAKIISLSEKYINNQIDFLDYCLALYDITNFVRHLYPHYMRAKIQQCLEADEARLSSGEPTMQDVIDEIGLQQDMFTAVLNAPKDQEIIHVSHAK